MANLYTPMQAQAILGVSATGLRIYTTTYPKQLSTEATGKRRKFTEADLRFLAYIKARTDAGDNHRELLAELETAEGNARFDAFADQWQPPEPQYDEEEEGTTALVPVAALQAARLLLEDAQRREQEAREEAAAKQEESQRRERELQEQINQLLRELGMKEGELNALKNKPKGWLARLLGGGE